VEQATAIGPWRRRHFATLASTSDVIRAAAEAGEADHLVVTATEQTAGRGRQGRSWSSPPGNLYCSLLLRPPVKPAVAAQLSFVCAVAVARSLALHAEPIRCKWPNDVLLNGAKCAGILLESRLAPAGTMDWVVVGIGINLVAHPDGLPYPATSLAAHGRLPHRDDVLVALLGELDRCYRSWLAEGFAPIRAAWLERAWRLGEEIAVRHGDETLMGRFTTLGEGGALVLDTGMGQRDIAAGEVLARI